MVNVACLAKKEEIKSLTLILFNDNTTYTIELQLFINSYLNIQFKKIYQVSLTVIQLVFDHMGTTKIKNISLKKGNKIDIGVRQFICNVSRRIRTCFTNYSSATRKSL